MWVVISFKMSFMNFSFVIPNTFLPFYLTVGNIDVYICPGDHLALSEQEDGAVVGGILATAVGIRYRTLCPSLPRLPTTFRERRAIHKFETGVDVVLYSRKGKLGKGHKADRICCFQYSGMYL